MPLNEKIKLREELGLIPRASAEEFQTLILNVNQSILAIKESLNSNLRALSIAAGFLSNQAISDVTDLPESFEEAFMTEKTNVPTANDFVSFSLIHSPELKQVEELIHAAQVSKKESKWNWLDPVGNDAGFLGAGFSSYIKISKSNLQSLLIQKQSLYTLIQNNAYKSYEQAENSEEIFRLLQEEAALREKNLKKVNIQFDIGTTVSLFDLMTAIQENYKTKIDVITARYNLFVSKSGFERSLMMGHYSNESLKP
jgi:outer membrane protein TolC